MRPLIREEILSAFSKRERKKVKLPDLELIDWDNLDFLGWIHPSGHLGFVVYKFPNGLRGIVLERTTQTLGSGVRMCSWCYTLNLASGIRLFTYSIPKTKITVGDYLCGDLQCSLYIRGIKKTDIRQMIETLTIPEKIQRCKKISKSFFQLSMKNLLFEKFLLTLGILLGLIIWKIIALKTFLPSPEEVLKILLIELKNGDLLTHISISLFRVTAGFSLAIIIGVPLGLLIGTFKLLTSLFSGLIGALKSIPPIALIPLVILCFGIGEFSKIYIIAYGAFFPIVLNTIFGVRSIDKNLIKMAKSMNLKGFKMFKEIILPGDLPSILIGLRTGLGVGWMCLIAAEMVGSNSGLGYMIEESRLILLIPKVILGTIIIAIFGFITDKFLQLLEKKITPWI